MTPTDWEDLVRSSFAAYMTANRAEFEGRLFRALLGQCRHLRALGH